MIPLGCAAERALGDLSHDPQRGVEIEAADALEAVREALPVQQLHHDVGATALVALAVDDLDDARVLDPRSGPRLGEEPSDHVLVRRELGQQDLDRGLPVDVTVLSQEHLTHAARAQPPSNPIRPDQITRFEHRRRTADHIRIAAESGQGVALPWRLPLRRQAFFPTMVRALPSFEMMVSFRPAWRQEDLVGARIVHCGVALDLLQRCRSRSQRAAVALDSSPRSTAGSAEPEARQPAALAAWAQEGSRAPGESPQRDQAAPEARQPVALAAWAQGEPPVPVLAGLGASRPVALAAEAQGGSRAPGEPAVPDTGGTGGKAAGGAGGTGAGSGTGGSAGTGATCTPACAASAYCNGGTCTSRVTEFSLQDIGARPRLITAGGDGNLWFTDSAYDKIRRISTAGTIDQFPVPTSGSGLGSITPGPDGNVWFCEENAGQIGRITPSGSVVEYPASPGTGIAIAAGITAGPDGNIWFTESNDYIGISTPGGVITFKKLATSGAGPAGITEGPDFNLWFVEAGINSVARMTPAGVVTEFPIPTPGSNPVSIVAGTDGALWFTESNADKIGRVTTAGTVTEFAIPTTPASPIALTVGADSNIWFTEDAASAIGRIDKNGVVTEFAVPADPKGIARGADGNLWFTEQQVGKIGRFLPP